MEDASLNLAHREHKQAIRHLHHRRFEDATRCHLLAVSHLKDAMILTSSPRVLESLQLQTEYHLRQVQIVRLKKTQFEVMKKALATKKDIMAHAREKFLETDKKNPETGNLQTAIYRTMEETDSLFELLVQRGGPSGDEVDGLSKLTVKDEQSTPPPYCEGSKRPKEDHTVIEELLTLNQQLRSLVEQLLSELNVCETENKALRIRIAELEAQQGQCEGRKLFQKQDTGLQVITDSTGGNYSPFVLSPISQLSPEVTETRELPPLAPLEMPQFDFSVLLTGQKGQQNKSCEK